MFKYRWLNEQLGHTDTIFRRINCFKTSILIFLGKTSFKVARYVVHATLFVRLIFFSFFEQQFLFWNQSLKYEICYCCFNVEDSILLTLPGKIFVFFSFFFFVILFLSFVSCFVVIFLGSFYGYVWFFFLSIFFYIFFDIFIVFF